MKLKWWCKQAEQGTKVEEKTVTEVRISYWPEKTHWPKTKAGGIIYYPYCPGASVKEFDSSQQAYDYLKNHKHESIISLKVVDKKIKRIIHNWYEEK